ncbi:RNA-binding protein [Bacteriovorax sp. Seq25_V]|uniref:RNA recognition motif domain-containing protein n=1 Tax=Bacteriovorax sp. Seq25_V TaxID=1201288 RepID=UPI00038A1744|nr:RNA-binding protein [Bacteriovorax sp. Seq25_V]EQC45369.1 hypothetical protein M900_1960 [Bacteriovorax sp. Seq25_V]
MTATLYVGNLNYERDDKGLKAIFSHYGRIKFIDIIKDDKGRSKGYAFIKMERAEDAKKAIAALDGKIIDKRTLKVSIANERADVVKKPFIEKYDEEEKEDIKVSFKKKKKDAQGLSLLMDMKSRKFKSSTLGK